MKLDDKVVFAVGKDADGVPMVVLGITNGAWNYMRDGKTHTFDLTKAGLRVRLMIYGGMSHRDVMEPLNKHLAGLNQPYEDRRHEDFSIKSK